MIDSALIVTLDEGIKWGQALPTFDSSGTLTPIDPSAPLDPALYARRDRELYYRDNINAMAICRVALEVESVWNSTVPKPVIQGLAPSDLPLNTSDLGLTTSKIRYVRNASVAADAIASDKDLATRDSLIYETLARACSILTNSPIAPKDPNSNVFGTSSAWGLCAGEPSDATVNASLPLNRSTFLNPDKSLAYRDNQLAGYASTLAQLLKNPFAYANRLYVSVSNVDVHEPEVYSLVELPFVVGEFYDIGSEVLYNGSWYTASVPNASDVPGTSAQWTVIPSPTKRVFSCEPFFQGNRNKIIYYTETKTLQWFRQNYGSLEAPQIAALSIPGVFPSQSVNTLTKVPESSDSYFWKIKADQIQPSRWVGTVLDSAKTMFSIPNITGGQVGCVGLSAQGSINWKLNANIQTGVRYHLSLSCLPSQSIQIYGGQNYGIYGEGVSGILGGATFINEYVPTSTSPGSPVTYKVLLPPSAWSMVIEYTNLSGSSTGFGLVVEDNGKVLSDDTVPLNFSDANGLPLPNGTIVKSSPIIVASQGGEHNLAFNWTYGTGQFHIRSITFITTGIAKGYYDLHCSLVDSVTGNNLSADGTACTYGVSGEVGVVGFDFKATASGTSPKVVLTWTDGGAAASQVTQYQLPLQFHSMAFQRVTYVYGSPDYSTFPNWSSECLSRSLSYIVDNFGYASNSGTLPLVSAGSTWTATDNEAWMSAIECYVPRLRTIKNVTSLAPSKQYLVSGSVTYNGTTYYNGDTFWSNSTANYTGTGTVTQIGVCLRALPSDIGRPALVPYGLYNNSGVPVMSVDTQSQIPVVTALEPWMLELGVYVLDYNPHAFVFDPPQPYAGDVVMLNPLPPVFTESVALSATTQNIDCVSCNFYSVNGNTLSSTKNFLGTGTFANGQWDFLFQTTIVTEATAYVFVAEAFDQWGNGYWSNLQATTQMPSWLQVTPPGGSPIADNSTVAAYASEGSTVPVAWTAYGPGCSLLVKRTDPIGNVTVYSRVNLGSDANTHSGSVNVLAPGGANVYTFQLVDNNNGFAVTPDYTFEVVSAIDGVVSIVNTDATSLLDFFNRVVLKCTVPSSTKSVEFFASTNPTSGFYSIGIGALSATPTGLAATINWNPPTIVSMVTQWFFYAKMTDAAGNTFATGWSTLSSGGWSSDYTWSGYQQFLTVTSYQQVPELALGLPYTSSGAGTTLYVDFSSFAPTDGYVMVNGSTYPVDGTYSVAASAYVAFNAYLYAGDGRLLATQNSSWTAPTPTAVLTATSPWTTSTPYAIQTSAGVYASVSLYTCAVDGTSRVLIAQTGNVTYPLSWNSTDNKFEGTYAATQPALATSVYFVADVTNQYGITRTSSVLSTTQSGYSVVLTLAAPVVYAGGGLLLTPTAVSNGSSITGISYYATDVTGSYGPSGYGSPVLVGTTADATTTLTTQPNLALGLNSLYYTAVATTTHGNVSSNITATVSLVSLGLWATAIDSTGHKVTTVTSEVHWTSSIGLAAYPSGIVDPIFGDTLHSFGSPESCLVFGHSSSDYTITFTLNSAQAAFLNSYGLRAKWHAAPGAYQNVKLLVNGTLVQTVGYWVTANVQMGAVFVVGTNNMAISFDSTAGLDGMRAAEIQFS